MNNKISHQSQTYLEDLNGTNSNFLPKGRDTSMRMQQAVRNATNDLFVKRNSEPFEHNNKKNLTAIEDDYPLQFVKQFQSTAKT